jgi:dTMP kinase
MEVRDPFNRLPAGVAQAPKRARLIVFEGTDGAGKTTAARRLVERLRSEGHSVSWHPNRTFRRVRDALNRLAADEGHEDRYAMLGTGFNQLLRGVFKFRELLEVLPELQRDDHWVVVDRYTYAHLALAGAFRTDNLSLLRSIYAVYPSPDITFYLDVAAETAAERVRVRGVDSNPVEFLADFRRAFHELDEFAGFEVIDAAASPDVVFAQVWARTTALVESLTPMPA